MNTDFYITLTVSVREGRILIDTLIRVKYLCLKKGKVPAVCVIVHKPNCQKIVKNYRFEFKLLDTEFKFRFYKNAAYLFSYKRVIKNTQEA